MRADRLVSIVLLLRQRGRLTASELATQLEVSTRTILRDVDALSGAGVPIYAERGRLGGFALLPGFRTELTGLNHEEVLALLVAGSRRGTPSFGLGSALASAMLKLADALPDGPRSTATEATDRLLVDPETDLLSRRVDPEAEAPEAVLAEVRRAVVAGRKLRLRYSPPGDATGTRWRTVDPVGLVTVRDQGYLLALRDGEDRTYRLDRVVEAEGLAAPAERPEQVDLEQLWRERSARFRAGGEQVTVTLRLRPTRREELARTALAIATETVDDDGWLRLEATFQDDRHARWAVWQLGTDAEALGPGWLRTALHDRARALAARYA